MLAFDSNIHMQCNSVTRAVRQESACSPFLLEPPPKSACGPLCLCAVSLGLCGAGWAWRPPDKRMWHQTRQQGNRRKRQQAALHTPIEGGRRQQTGVAQHEEPAAACQHRAGSCSQAGGSGVEVKNQGRPGRAGRFRTPGPTKPTGTASKGSTSHTHLRHDTSLGLHGRGCSLVAVSVEGDDTGKRRAWWLLAARARQGGAGQEVVPPAAQQAAPETPDRNRSHTCHKPSLPASRHVFGLAPPTPASPAQGPSAAASVG